MNLRFTPEDFMTLDCDVRKIILDLYLELRRKTLWGERLFVAHGASKPFTTTQVSENVLGTLHCIRRNAVIISYRWWDGKKGSKHDTKASHYVWADDARWRPYILKYDRQGASYIEYLDVHDE